MRRRLTSVPDEVTDVPPLKPAPRYRVRESTEAQSLVTARVDRERGVIVVTLPNGQWFEVSPRVALAVSAVVSVTVGDSFPDTGNNAVFETDRSRGEGRWEPWNGFHRD